MNIMSSKINYIFNQGFQDTFTPGYTDSSGGITSQSTTKQSSNISYISDNNLINRSSTEKGLGEYFDVSFSSPFDVSNLESIVIYSSPEIKNYLIQKIRYETIGNVKLDVSEIQLWVNNENIITTDKLTSFYQTSTVSSLANAFDNNINTRAETNVGVGEYFDMSFTGFDLSDIQSFVVYNNTPNNETRLLLYDDSDNLIILNNNSSNINSTDNIIKFKGESYEKNQRKLQTIRFQTNDYSTLNLNELQIWVDNSNIAPTSTITQSSIFDASANVNDSSLNTFARTQKGIGEFIDVSLNYPIAANRIQSIIAYSDILLTNNQLIKKIRIETIESHSLEIEEVQIWKDSNNIISDFTGVLSTSTNDVSLAFDGSFNTYAKTNTGIGEYIDLSSNTGFNYDDLQTIVVYSNNGLNKTKIILYDDSNIAVTEHYNNKFDIVNKKFKFNGPQSDSTIPRFDRMRFDTTTNAQFNINEMQVWMTDSSRNLGHGTSNDLSSINIMSNTIITSNTDPESDNTSKINDSNFDTFIKTEKSTSSFINVKFNKLYDVSSLSSVIAYSNNLGNVNPLIGKLTIESTTNNSLDISEIQVWYDNSNVAKVVDVSSSNMFDGSIQTNNKISFDNASVDVSFVPFNYDSLQSIIIYENNYSDLSNIKLTFFDGFNNELFFYNTSSGPYSNTSDVSDINIFKFKGKEYASSIPKLKNIRFSTTNYSHLDLNEVQLYVNNVSGNILSNSSNFTITQSSTYNTDISSQIHDQNFGTIARTQKGFNEFIDISLNEYYDVSNIQALIAYSTSQNDTNPTITKIRYQTTSDVKLKIGEFQVWVDNSNIASNINNSSSSIDGIYDLSNLNDSNLYTYISTNQGIGEYIDISLNNYFNFNDLQGIVTYIDESIGNFDYQKTTKLILFDDSNIPIVELSNNILDHTISSLIPEPKYSFDFRDSTRYANNSYSSDAIFNQIQVVKTEPHTIRFSLHYVEVWVNGVNVALSSIGATSPSPNWIDGDRNTSDKYPMGSSDVNYYEDLFATITLNDNFKMSDLEAISIRVENNSTVMTRFTDSYVNIKNNSDVIATTPLHTNNQYHFHKFLNYNSSASYYDANSIGVNAAVYTDLYINTVKDQISETTASLYGNINMDSSGASLDGIDDYIESTTDIDISGKASFEFYMNFTPEPPETIRLVPYVWEAPFTYNGVTYGGAGGATWHLGTNPHRNTGIDLNHRTFTSGGVIPGDNEYWRSSNLFYNKFEHTSNRNHWTNPWAQAHYSNVMYFPYYIIWRTDGTKTANRIRLYSTLDYPQVMPKRFDIVSFAGVLTDFENVNKSFSSTSWNVIKEITEPSQLPSYSTWDSGTAEEVSPGEPWKKPYYIDYEFDATTANYFGIKVYSSHWTASQPTYDMARMYGFILYGIPTPASTPAPGPQPEPSISVSPIHYTFDNNGENTGYTGTSNDLTIPTNFSISTTNNKIGTGSLDTRDVDTNSDADNRTDFPAWTTPANGFSISLWGKSANWISTNQRLFSANMDGDKVFVIAFNTSTNFLIFYNGSFATPPIPNTFDNNFHNFVFTFSDKTIKSYIDNVLYSTFTVNNSFTSISIEELYIGAAANADPVYNGFIDDFKIYDYVLVNAQISAIYSEVELEHEIGVISIINDSNDDGLIISNSNQDIAETPQGYQGDTNDHQMYVSITEGQSMGSEDFDPRYNNGSNMLDSGTMTHVVIVYDTGYKIYKNGSLHQSKGSIVSNLSSILRKLRIGNFSWSNPTYYSQLIIKQLRIFDYALTSSQVTSLYNEKENTNLIPKQIVSKSFKYKGPSHRLNRRQIDHFRLETINYSSLDVNEIQMWVDGSNILHDFSSHSISHSLESNDTSSILFNNNNLTDSLRIEKGLGKFIDISLNTPLDVSKLEAIVYYSDIKNDYNPLISKVRFESIGNVGIDLNEIQIWKDNSNIISDYQIVSSSTDGIKTVSNLIDNTLETDLSTNTGVGEYIDLLLDNSLNLNDIQSIVTFRDPIATDLSKQKLYRVKLYDDSNIPFIILDNSELSTESSIHKYIGPAHNNLISQFSNFRIETIESSTFNISEVQLWVNDENIIANKQIINQITETLVATESVSNSGNYNGNLMNWPQSIFAGAMGSDTKTVSGLTGNLSKHNGTYTLTWTSEIYQFNDPMHNIFSASAQPNQYSDGVPATILFTNSPSSYSSTISGTGYPYIGNVGITYYQDDNTAVTVNGIWFAIEFPAYINFTTAHHFSDDWSRAGTYIGRDANGINRLVGTYENSWVNGNWVGIDIPNTYYVNKLYLVITKSHGANNSHFTIAELFFDGNYEISPTQTIYYNNSIVTVSNLVPNSNNIDLSSVVNNEISNYLEIDKGIGQFIDISLNNIIDTSSIQSIVVYSDIKKYNPTLRRIRIETTKNVKLQYNEIQVWTTNSLTDISFNLATTSLDSGYDTIYTNDVSSSSGIIINAFDNNKTTYFTSDKGIGEYVDIQINNTYFNDIQSIITYSYEDVNYDLSNLESTKIILYDDSNVSFIEYNKPEYMLPLWLLNTSTPNNIFDFRTSSSLLISDKINKNTNAILGGGSTSTISDGVTLDGTNDNVILPTIDLSGNFSIELYVYINSTINNEDTLINFSNGNDGNNNGKEFRLLIKDNKFKFKDTYTGHLSKHINDWIPQPTISTNSWNHLVMVSENNLSSFKFYVNGTPYTTNYSLKEDSYWNFKTTATLPTDSNGNKLLQEETLSYPSPKYIKIDHIVQSINIHQVELYQGTTNIALNKPVRYGINNATYENSTLSTPELTDNNLSTDHRGLDSDQGNYWITLDDGIEFNSLSTILIRGLNTGGGFALTKRFAQAGGTNYRMELFDSNFNLIWTTPNYVGGSDAEKYTVHIAELSTYSSSNYDTYRNGNDTTLTNTYSYVPISVTYSTATIYNSYLDSSGIAINGNNSYVDLGSNSINLSNDLNIETDITFNENTDYVGQQSIFYINEGNETYHAYRDNSNIKLEHINETTTKVITGKMVTNNVKIRSILYDDSIKLYIDDKLEGIQEITPFTNTIMTTNYIGKGTKGDMSGVVSYFKVYHHGSGVGDLSGYFPNESISKTYNYYNLASRNNNTDYLPGKIKYFRVWNNNSLTENNVQTLYSNVNSLSTFRSAGTTYNFNKFKGPSGYQEDVINETLDHFRIETTDSQVALSINEMQLWVNGNNILPSSSVITQSSTIANDYSSNIIDQNLLTKAVTNVGINQFIDVSLNSSIEIKDIQSLVIYSSGYNHNPKINKIRYVTTDNVSIKLDEVKLFKNSVNQLSSIPYSTTDGLGNFFDISTNLIRFNEIESIESVISNLTIYDPSQISKTKIQFYDESNILFGEIDNKNNNLDFSTWQINLPDTSFNITYRGTKVKRLAKIRIETIENTQLGLEELQVWSENNNIIANDFDPDKPTNTFILTGDNKSLTDIYSTNSLILVGSPTFDSSGVHLTGTQYITIPQVLGGFGTGDFTMSLWIESNDSYNSGPQHILSLRYNQSGSILLYSNINDNIPRIISVYHNGKTPSDFIYPNDSTEHNYVLSRKENTIRLFIDGVKKIETSNTSNVPIGDYHIGYSFPADTGRYLHGIVKRVDIWKGKGYSD